jgi:FlaG/FlaF family flagellin (archaellin)
MSDDAVGPITIIAAIATIAVVVILANTALSAFGASFKNITGTDIFMRSEYTAVWNKVSQFAWALIVAAFVGAAFMVWRVIRER